MLAFVNSYATLCMYYFILLARYVPNIAKRSI